MTTEILAFHQRIKTTVADPSVCKHGWESVSARITLFPLMLPKISILGPTGASYPLTLGVVTRIIGELLEMYRRSDAKDTPIGDNEENIVIDLVRSTFSHRHISNWTEGSTYTELDLLAVIERLLIDRNMTGLAQILAHRMPTENTRANDVRARVIRRNGSAVGWNQQKIEISVRKALQSVGLEGTFDGFAAKVAHAVTARIRNSDQTYFRIEEVQDIVEQVMVEVWSQDTNRDAQVFSAIRAYMNYRVERAQIRGVSPAAEVAVETTQLELPAVERLAVVEPDGVETVWDGEDLRARIKFAVVGLDLNLTVNEIEKFLRASLYEKMKRTDIAVTVNLNAKTLIEKDADFAKFAGRIQLTYIYEEVLGWDILRDGIGKLREMHRRYFPEYIDHGIKIDRLTPKLREFDLDQLAAALDPINDLEFDFLGIQTLYDRYLIIDKTGANKRRMETPQIFWMRVSMGLFLTEQNKERITTDYYKMVSARRFCPSTPTLFNSGTLHSQLSSCFLYYVGDSLDQIFGRGIYDNAQLSKWAGGLGGSWTAVRGTGAYIKGTNGESQGVIPFLKLHNDQLVAVNQGGKRKGSGCAYLETWHNDIFEFLELRKNTGDDRRRTHDMNTANWIPDLFMKRMEARGTWTLFRSNETPDLHELYGKKFEEAYIAYEKLAEAGKIRGEKVEALELWKKMLGLLFETGHPWITFKDACNVRSPQDHAGVIHSSNLCTEITLNTSKDETAVCNLGSVILSNHLRSDGTLDLGKIRDTVRLAVRGLDNVIDLNFYPTEAAKNANMRHRPIGMGVMGVSDALYIKGVPFASQEAVEFNDEFMEAIAFYAYEASSDLAAERGTYQSYKGSKWDRGLLPQDTIDLLEQERGVPVEVPRGGKLDWAPLREKIRQNGMRNSNVLAIAPTATISNITGVGPCIEPTYKNLYVKSNLSGEFIVLNPYLVKDLKARGLWNQETSDNLKYYDGELTNIDNIPADIKQRYRTAFDIDPKWVVEAAARRQKWIDQSQSVNLWLKVAGLKELSHMYRHAWRAGLKTTYYLRTLSASNIEKATVSVKKEVRGAAGVTSVPTPPAPAPVASKQTYTAEEKRVCSIEAQKNGESCEMCQ